MIKERVVEYIVKFDGEFHQGFSSLKDARQYVKDIPVKFGINNMPNTIHIVKSTTVYKVLNEYKPKPTVVLQSTSTFDDVDLA